jgi:hypothetical protein
MVQLAWKAAARAQNALNPQNEQPYGGVVSFMR